MAKGLFILGFLALLSYNVFLFRENRRLTGEIDVLRAEVSYDKNKSDKIGKNLEVLNLFLGGISEDSNVEMMEKFRKAVGEIRDSEIASRYQEVKKSESADGLIKFADFITQKSLEGLRE